MRLIASAMCALFPAFLPATAQAAGLNFDPEPKAYYDKATQVKSFSWQNTMRFMSSHWPVVAYNAWAKPQELVAPMVTLYFYRQQVTFDQCDDIEWEIDGRVIAPLGHDYKAVAPQSQLSTETFRFAFAWEDLERLASDQKAVVRICNEHIPIIQKEKIALGRMLDALVRHSVDPNPERTAPEPKNQ